MLAQPFGLELKPLTFRERWRGASALFEFRNTSGVLPHASFVPHLYDFAQQNAFPQRKQ